MSDAARTIRRPGARGLAVVLAVVGCLWLAGQASANVYWGSLNLNRIGRANPDGSEVEPNLVTGALEPWGVALDGKHLYWANEQGNTIGRSNLDGSDVEADFISAAEPTGLAVAEGHIYWISPGPREIGRAKLDGSEVEAEFIPHVEAFAGLAASSEFIYWGDTSGSGSIGRARLGGSGVEEDFIDPVDPIIPYGVAVDASHVYWANSMNDSIGRADIDGGSIEEEFIPNAHPAGVAVDANYVYWGKAQPPEAIGRADIDGGNIQSNFIPGAEEAFGLATDLAPATLSTSPAVSLKADTIRAITTLEGANAPTGTIGFDLFGPGDEACAGTPLASSTVPVSGNGSYRSPEFTPTQAGTYRWKAAYSGDVENDPINGACEGAVTVTPAPASTPLALTPNSWLQIVARERDRRRGKARVAINVSGPGELVLSGKHLKKVASDASKAGIVKLAVSPTGALARELIRHRTARAGVKVTFTPSGGMAVVKQLRMRLTRR
jgi:virginiamycin B lyase